jgi:peptidylprolyl isomerase
LSFFAAAPAYEVIQIRGIILPACANPPSTISGSAWIIASIKNTNSYFLEHNRSLGKMENQYPLPPPPEPQKSKRKVIIVLSIVVCIIAAIILVTYVIAQSNVAAAASTFETSTQGFEVTNFSLFPPSVDANVNVVVENPSAIQFTVDRCQADVYVKCGSEVYSIGSMDVADKPLPPNGYVTIPIVLHCDSGVINFIAAHPSGYQVTMNGKVSVSGKYLFWTISNEKAINVEAPIQTLTNALGQIATPSPTPAPSGIPAAADPYANSIHILLHTSMGDITLALRNDMPITTGNFVNLVNQGAYDGSTFHRVIESFMIQSGQLANGSAAQNIQDEFTTTNHNYNGTISMANTGARNSGSSQFFINTNDNNNRYSTFDSTYPAFGKVISGMDVVMAISQVATGSNDKPLQDITLISAIVLP